MRTYPAVFRRFRNWMTVERSRTHQLHRRTLELEVLESRLAPATFTWTAGGDGVSWHDIYNWDATNIPTIADDVVINDLTGMGSLVQITSEAEAKGIQLGPNTTLQLLTTFGEGLTADGTVLVNSGATLEFLNFGTHNFTVDSIITGAGNFKYAGGILNIFGSFTPGAPTTIDGSALYFYNAATINTVNLKSGGIFGNSTSAPVTITGQFNWTGGEAGAYLPYGSPGTGAGIVIASSGRMNIFPDPVSIEGVAWKGQIVNNGTARWIGDIDIFSLDAVFVNIGSFEIQGDARMRYDARVDNFGTFFKSAGDPGTGETTIEWEFKNFGNLVVQQGVLNINSTPDPFVPREFQQFAGQTLVGAGAQLAFSTFAEGFPDFGTGVMNLQGGLLGGNGTVIGTVINTGGIVSPGASPGTLTVQGDYIQNGSVAAIFIEIGGLDPLHDLFATTPFGTTGFGTMQILAGNLNIATINGFLPTAGDRFRILSFTNGSINFTSVTGLDLGNGLFYEIEINPTDVTLVGRGVLIIPPDLPPPDISTPPPDITPPDIITPPTIDLLPPAVIDPPATVVTVDDTLLQQAGLVLADQSQQAAKTAKGNTEELPYFIPTERTITIPILRYLSYEFGFNTMEVGSTGGAAPDQKGEIHGEVFHDYNGNGIQDRGEPALERQTVYIDQNNNGRYDLGEPFTATDSTGRYHFTGLAFDRYQVRIMLGSRTDQTYPNLPQIHSIELRTTRPVASRVNFGAFERRLRRQPRGEAPRIDPASAVVEVLPEEVERAAIGAALMADAPPLSAETSAPESPAAAQWLAVLLALYWWQKPAERQRRGDTSEE